jgi:hypothetical protein
MWRDVEKLQVGDLENLLRSPEAAWYGPPTLPKNGTTELHLVVACADRKSTSAGEPVRLGAVEARSVEERCAAWWRRLSDAPAHTSARDLYVGDHWSVAKGLPALASAKGFVPRLWVASAGYGLVPAEATLASYSATFAKDSEDSVATNGADPRQAAQQWWGQLAKRRLRGHDGPRTLVGLAERAAPGAAVMVVASPAYVDAMADDLTALACGGSTVRLMIVTSTFGTDDGPLRDHWIPTSAALRMVLGGALTSLHTRVARRLIEKISPSDLDATSARRHIERLAARAPELPTLRRERSDDAPVQNFIREALRQDAAASHTRLLREYRASGRACEQGRFRELFMIERQRR